MSVQYRPVIWNRNKLVYDLVLIAGVALYLWLYIRWSPGWLYDGRPFDGAIVRMRAYGTCAFFMLTIILCIGPLARLDKRFLPLLYNRRHFGVMTFIIALAHVDAVRRWYHNFSDTDSWVSLLSSSSNPASFLAFPFEWLGIAALVIMFVMAVTSHDFWLSFLTPPIWKTLHMGVYLAYGLLAMHVALGTLQTETSPVYPMVFGGCLVLVAGLHLGAGFAERARDEGPGVSSGVSSGVSNWVLGARLGELRDGFGHTVTLPGGERAAIFRFGDKISAISNLCAHQNGPLGEGRIIDGCVTCPWHGYQYRPEDGCSPPPFTEKVATYHLKLQDDKVMINTNAEAPGTYIEPITVAATV
ncbi:MAG: Rieske 2Fe-2S domain-containing protein [Pseudomonadota bacterium]